MPNSPANPPTVTLTVRLEPQLLRQVHQLADRREMTVSAAARHLMVVGMDQLLPAA
jgi:hypothetical protein